MQLASQELFGFKSFAKRTRFEFGSGVTIIVGPNGCGKSNVVDSLKWVLGEQSAKSLRGHEMMDVIFNGSKNRKPLGFAEATLSFRGCKGVIHSELDEISVTRKLYRSGESEYQINRTPCRLKDIRELFMDTGVGMKAYSIIEQGRIDALLQASGAERRAIFDEAAGISKYKSRKKEAQRRLERTDQNLIIIDSTLEQVAKQLHSLKVQAGKARKAREYQEELRRFRVAHALHRYHGLKQVQIRVSGEIVLAESERESTAADLAAQEAELSVLEDQLQDHEDRHRKAAAEEQRLDQQLISNRQRKTSLVSHLEDLGREEIRLQTTLTECLNQIERGRTDLEGSKERLAAERSEEAALLASIGQAEAGLAQVSASFEAVGEREGALKAEGLENEAGQSAERTRAGRIEEDLARLGKERAGVEATHRDSASRHERAAAEIARLAGEIAELKEAAKGLAAEYQDVQTELTVLQEKRTLLEKKDESLQERKLVVTSRVDVLQKYRDRLEGVGEGASWAVREAGVEQSPLTGVVGLLADRFRVPAPHVKAIEAALSSLADAVVVEDLPSGLRALEILRERGKGRGCFVARDAAAPSAPAEDFRVPGVVGRAADLVDCADEDRPLLEMLLGRTLITETLTAAVGLKDLLGAGYAFVTPAGEIFDPRGVLAGGAALKGRLSHAAELKELGEESLRLKVEMDALRIEREELGKQVGSVEEKWESLRRQIFELKRYQILMREEERQRFEAQAEELGAQLAVLAGELDRIGQDQESREAELKDARDALGALVARASDLRAGLEAVAEERRALETVRAERERAYHDLRVKQAVVAERVHSQQAEVDRVTREIRTREEEYRDTVVRIEENGVRREGLRGDIAALEEEVMAAARKLDAVRQEAEELRHVCDGLRQDVSLKEAEARTLRTQLDDVRQRLNELQMKENEFKVRIEEAVSRAAEELRVVLPDLYDEFDDEGCDWEENERRIGELKDRLDKLGNVNYDAIEQCDEVQARHDYLAAQKNDLVTAKEQLLSVIRKIDKRSKELFVASFADIRESFKVLFRKLFGGGKADIFLENEQDVLESPVEVLAQPKDKKPASISLLSGGEKVMTCIALLFAIFKAKPSPFCILDEVDAALDEGNIDRFVSMLDEFVKGSQFIIISHNKKTMMVGDAIFGVTMQEPGVSKKVSLKIEEAHRVVDEDAVPEEAAAREEGGEDASADFFRAPHADQPDEPLEEDAPAPAEAGAGEAPAAEDAMAAPEPEEEPVHARGPWEQPD